MKICQRPLIKNNTLRFLLTTSHIFGMVCFIAALVLYLFDVRLAAIPLVVFILICFFAPFFPGFGFFLPVIHKGSSNRNGIALTFDDGPDPVTTPLLLDLLSRYEAPSTFFVTGEKADMYPNLIQHILSKGHCIANHSYTHDTLMMLKSSKYLHYQIKSTQVSLKKQGVTTFAFRPPAGITNPKLSRLLDINGLYCVNFNRRARDGGNRWIKKLSKKILSPLKPNDIIMLHDTLPKGDNRLSEWIGEIEKLLQGVKEKGFIVLPLSEIIGKPVMELDKNNDLYDNKE